jgi:hypothetical protein
VLKRLDGAQPWHAESDTRMNDQAVGLVNRSSSRFRLTLFSAAPKDANHFGFHMDIQRVLSATGRRREWTTQDERALKKYSKEKTPDAAISKALKRKPDAL